MRFKSEFKQREGELRDLIGVGSEFHYHVSFHMSNGAGGTHRVLQVFLYPQ